MVLPSYSPLDRLAELGIALPPVAPPTASYQPAVRSGSFVYTSGQLPLVDGKLTVHGKVGADVTDAQRAADLAYNAAVVNGASELLQEVFGDLGAHARSAVGVAALPMDAPVEVELLVEIR